MLAHLPESEILTIIRLAELNNVAHPDNEIGILADQASEPRQISDAQREALRDAISSLSQEARLELMALIFFCAW